MKTKEEKIRKKEFSDRQSLRGIRLDTKKKSLKKSLANNINLLEFELSTVL